ncbi:MAG: hypothetical protein H7Y17_00290 [Chlorobia bacterium]|nr:hypothetical protein [Fimbriimonadaceae bacterium]
MKKFVAILALAVVAVGAFAQNPAGSWKGKLKVDPASMPKAQSPEQQKMMDQVMTQIKTMTFTLNMKPNKTFTILVPSMMGQPAQNGEGTWSQKGKTITLVTTKQNGKAPKNSKPQIMNIDSGGRKMILNAGDGPRKATITFTK